MARPHVGAGVAKAAEDALALAERSTANTDVESRAEAVRGRARCRSASKIIARARHLGAYVQADLKTEAERVYAARHRTPEAVLTETAMMDF